MALLPGPDRQDYEVGSSSVGDPKLLPSYDELVTFQAATSLKSGDVGPASRLAYSESGNSVAGYGRPQKFLSLFVGSQLLENRECNLRLDEHSHRDAAAVAVGDAFEVGASGPPVKAAAAPPGIDANAE